jgi:hypothetical protein
MLMLEVAKSSPNLKPRLREIITRVRRVCRTIFRTGDESFALINTGIMK